MTDPQANLHWSEQQERGSYFALRFMLFLYRIGGKWICRLLVYPIVFYFFITGRKTARASRQYLNNLYDFAPGHANFKRRPGTWHVFLHFLEFGRSAMDKLASWTGDIKRSNLTWPNRQDILDLVNRGQGGVLIGSHLGCMDVMRGIAAQNPELKFNALVFIEHAQHINEMLRIANPGIEVRLISVQSFTADIAILLAEKVEKGEFIVILGDRSPAGARDRVETVSFLGKPAPWPTGPMILASLLHCPIFLIFCLRTKGRRFHVHLEPFEAERLDLPRKERQAHLRQAIDRYARIVEKHCCIAPYQWFNFYDFWDNQPAQPQAARGTE